MIKSWKNLNDYECLQISAFVKDIRNNKLEASLFEKIKNKSLYRPTNYSKLYRGIAMHKDDIVVGNVISKHSYRKGLTCELSSFTKSVSIADDFAYYESKKKSRNVF